MLVPGDQAIVDVRIEPLAVRRELVPGAIALSAPLLSSSGQELPRRHLEPQDGAFPATWGQFGGLHTWRGYRLLAVNLHPLRIVQQDGQTYLEVLERFAVHAVIDESRAPAPILQRERQIPGSGRASSRRSPG